MVSNPKPQPLEYSHDGVTFIGQYMAPVNQDEAAPGILVAPAFGGLGPLEIEYAGRLAEEGYAALAVDYYGSGQRVGTEQEAFALMRSVENNRPVLASRMQAALAALREQPQVRADRIGSIGFCFGGKAVLDLARSGADIRACVPIHGVYDAPPDPAQTIPGSVLILHGWDDPLATPEQLQELADELDPVCDDWNVFAFGKTGHAFTNPNAQSHDAGMGYSARASQRTWDALTRFFEETLRD